MTQARQKPMPEWLPFVIGVLLVIQFAGLGGWQVSRGLEKRATRQAFDAPAGFDNWSHGMPVRAYQKLEVTGRFDVDHQFWLDNIIMNGRYGYYVLTPLAVDAAAPLLLVNRGWREKSARDLAAENLALPSSIVTVRGRAGSLPRPGRRMGDALQPESKWPRRAVYPTLAELAAALGRDVQPFVLLLDPHNEHGYLRNWQPLAMGPAQHFAYALQWFGIAAVLGVLLAWHRHKRRFRPD